MSRDVAVLPGQTVLPGAERGDVLTKHEVAAMEWAANLNKSTRRKYQPPAADVLAAGGGLLTPAAVVAYRDAMGEKRPNGAPKLQPATIRARMAAVRNLARWLHEHGQIDRDALAAIEAVKLPSWRGDLLAPRAPTDDVIARMMAAATAQAATRPVRAATDEAVLALAGGCGLRRAEACAVLWDDYVYARPTSAAKGALLGRTRPAARQLHVQRDVKRGQPRKVPVPDLAAQALDRLAALHRKAYGSDLTGLPILVALPGGHQADALPARADVRNMSVDALVRTVTRLADAAGATVTVTPHSLRHAYAMRLIEGGASLANVSARLGHTNPSSTLRYVRPSEKSEGTDSWDT
jgi:integrase/recombinase XerD